MIAACPCCGGPLVGESIGLGAIAPDARAGDRYCPTCDWLFAREGLEIGNWPWACPIHPEPLLALLTSAQLFSGTALDRFEPRPA